MTARTGQARQRVAALRAACDAGAPTGTVSMLALACAADVEPLCDALDDAGQEAESLRRRLWTAEETGSDLRRRACAVLARLDRHPPSAATPGNVAVLYTSIRLILEAGRDSVGNATADAGAEAAA